MITFLRLLLFIFSSTAPFNLSSSSIKLFNISTLYFDSFCWFVYFYSYFIVMSLRFCTIVRYPSFSVCSSLFNCFFSFFLFYNYFLSLSISSYILQICHSKRSFCFGAYYRNFNSSSRRTFTLYRYTRYSFSVIIYCYNCLILRYFASIFSFIRIYIVSISLTRELFRVFACGNYSSFFFNYSAFSRSLP